MEGILQNEIKRQEDMELRYKSLEEDSTKPDLGEDSEDKIDKVLDDAEAKYMEENFNVDKLKILEELGFIILSNDNKDKHSEEDNK